MNELSIFKKDQEDFDGMRQRPQTTICRPAQMRPMNPVMVKFENAVDLAKSIDIDIDSRHYVLVSGNFIFGDFFEALITEKGYNVEEMIISTLSLSQENVDSLQNLIEYGHTEERPFVLKLTLIVSDYFYSHERKNLIPYIYDKLNNGRFQLAVAGSHTKIAIIKTTCGKHIVIHGSANLRSSENIEQMMIEESKTLYDFNYLFMSKIADNFATIKKPLRYAKLWKIVNENGKT